MKHTHHLTALVVGLATLTSGSAFAGLPQNDTVLIPERAISLTGDLSKADKDILAVFYSRENLEVNEPLAPRFLLIDRDGKIAFGLGGQFYGFASYDFDGAIDSPGFTTYDIAVPNNPAERQRFGADASHSALTARLVGKSSKIGLFQVYFQAKFVGDDGGYGFKLKQAYVGVWNLTAGLTNSTFVDPATQAMTIDPEGPSGQIAGKTMLFRYTTPERKGFKGAISIEVPKTSFTEGKFTESISQRVPDIPIYVQYSWQKGAHVRLSGIFRDFCYRDLLTGKNRFEAAWGVKFSAIGTIPSTFIQPFGHVAYGQGIGTYVNDLSGNGYDLIPDVDKAGRMKAAKSVAWTAGLYLNLTSHLTVTSSFSRAQVFDCRKALGSDSYRWGQYAVANAFYNVDNNLVVGAEYIHGWRCDYNGVRGHANRFNVLLQYSF